MLIRQRRYSKEELAHRGDEIYYRDLHALVYPLHKGKYMAIDVETGEWELDADALTACDRLIARIPDAQSWLLQVGKRSIHHIGGPRRVVERL